MAYIQLFISNDAVHDTIAEIGHAGIVEFCDLNPDLTAFHRPYAADVRKCEEMERQLRLIENHTQSIQGLDRVMSFAHTNDKVTLDELHEKLLEVEQSLADADKHILELNRALALHTEHMNVLTRCEELYLFLSNPKRSTERLLENPARDVETELVGRVGKFTGSVENSKVASLERLLFRASRGNSYLKFSDDTDWVFDGATNLKVEKRVFMLYYYSANLGKKIQKLLDSFDCKLYDFPEGEKDRMDLRKENSESIRSIRSVLEKTTEARTQELKAVAKNFFAWRQFVSQEKNIFHIMNLLEQDLKRSCKVAEGWCPTRYLDDVSRALERGMDTSGAQIPSIWSEVPPRGVTPTYFETNKLTSGFQAIVDAYGVADYREMNPMPFTVITFPFLFAVMFGDVGHAVLMFLFCLYMLKNESYYLANTPGEIFAICFNGRYVLLLMSLFSLYTGMLYNETFSMGFNLFGSAYKINTTSHGADMVSDTCVFGMDPIWKQATNELAYTNSLKMKMSIVFGVVQMTFGVVLSATNAVCFGDWITFIHEFIPRMLFLGSIFGYLVIMIFAKWGTHYENTHCAPSVLTTLIDMFLDSGNVNKADPSCDIVGFFPGQADLQRFLLSIAFITVPWMLFAKPLLLARKHRKQYAHFEGEVAHGLPQQHEFDFAEEMIHQMIHTIEFVLGAVSNTASYLRLWALSLAHAQLSVVFWERTMVAVLEHPSKYQPIMIVVAFVIWTCCTIGVLMVMESLSAFLHALRLHWVEFQNKFYSGTGIKFSPLTFGDVTSGHDD
eukprot:c5651_g1_i1.p1 GENE.c5651_g1_i1~~c5651_g1_i1.p1  ORF type:complete len:825 (+),score=219.03 c5651_g1_i1:125-2476(+)